MNPEPDRDRETADADALDMLCEAVFESLPRADQRRWAATYVRGLVAVPGRKSVRRISERAGGRSIAQNLQQFVNQSPWDWGPVRHVLARVTEATVPSAAFVLQEVEFPKDGRHSAGVGARYLPASGRSVNCQLGLVVWLAGQGCAVPANWRLMLPPGWDGDPARRAKARVPPAERHSSDAEHILSSLDEMLGSWSLTARPVVGDRRQDRDIAPLLNGLDERNLGYALRISDRTAVPATGLRSPRLVVRWPRGRSRGGELWLTSQLGASMPEVLSVLAAADAALRSSLGLRVDSGLDHFEGRSFQGWHHHVTLASVAHAHRVLPARRRLLAGP